MKTMNLENGIKDVISQKLTDGTVEKLVAEYLEKGVKEALSNLFRSYGDVTKIIEEKVKSVMVPYLESYDYSTYITKLDSVLVEVLKSTALDNKKLLENFKDLITEPEEKSIKVSDLYERWMKYVAENVKTDDLQVIYDDGVSYEPVEVSFEVQEEEGRSWSSFEQATLFFECEHDEEMNFQVRLSRWKDSEDKGWDIRFDRSPEIRSLRRMNEFEILLMNLTQNSVTLILDEMESRDEVQPEKESEATFS